MEPFRKPRLLFALTGLLVGLVLLTWWVTGCAPNEPPRIREIKVSDSSPPPGERIDISVEYDNPSGVTLNFVWTADKGKIVSGQGGPAIIYQAPEEPGIYNVSVKVEWDGGSVVTGTLISVPAKPQPATPTDTLTSTPTVGPADTPTSTPTMTPTTLAPPTSTPTLTITVTPSPRYGLTIDEAEERIRADGVITVFARFDAPGFGEDPDWSKEKCDPKNYEKNFDPGGYDILVDNESGRLPRYDILVAEELGRLLLNNENAVKFHCVLGPDRGRAVREHDSDVRMGVYVYSRLPERCIEPPLIPEDSNDMRVWCSDSYMSDGLGVLVTRASQTTQLCSSNIITVAAVISTSAQFRFVTGFNEACPGSETPKLAIVDNRDIAIELLRSGKVSAYATNVEILRKFAEKPENSDLYVARGEFGQEEISIAVTPGETGLLELINSKIQKMREEGKLIKLMEQAGFECIPGSTLRPSCPTPGAPYPVKYGDTPLGIARQAYGDNTLYPCILKANNIPDAQSLPAGEEILIPLREDC